MGLTQRIPCQNNQVQRRVPYPATYGLIALLSLTFLIQWFSGNFTLFEWMMLGSGELGQKPWSLITYPFIQGGPFFWFLIQLLWLYSIGTFVERDLGVTRMLLVWAISTVIGGLMFVLGHALSSSGGILAGALIPISTLTVLWAARYPQMETRIWGILPVKAMWIGWIAAGVILFDLGKPPVVGVTCLVPLALAWAFAAGKLPLAYGSAPLRKKKLGPRGRVYKEEYYDDVKRREVDRKERERLRKLFEDSLGEDK